MLRIRATPARGFFGLGGQWSLPGWPDQEESFLRTLSYEGKAVYDIGANVGATTLFFSQSVKEGGMVMSFEPNPDVLPILALHVRLNRCTNVRLFPYAIGHETRISTLAVPLGGRGAATLKSTLNEARRDYEPVAELFGPAKSIDEAVASKHEVQQTTLDQFLVDHDLPAPAFIKIDTEGFEKECLLGMKRTLVEHRPTLLLEVHGYSDEEKRNNASDIVQILTRNQYALCHLQTGTRLTRDNSVIAKRGHIFASVNPNEL